MNVSLPKVSFLNIFLKSFCNVIKNYNSTSLEHLDIEFDVFSISF